MLGIMFYLFYLEFLQGTVVHLAVLGEEINMKKCNKISPYLVNKL